MSRSYRRNPIVKDYSRGGTKEYKRLASKMVRRYRQEIQDGSSYKKLFCSYNIHDWKYMPYWHDDLEDRKYWTKKMKRK